MSNSQKLSEVLAGSTAGLPDDSASQSQVFLRGDGVWTNVGSIPALQKEFYNRRLISSWERTQVINYDRYVDSVNGSDLNDGTTPAFVSGTTGPWQTLTKVNTAGLANQKIGLACGSVFTTTFTVPQNGMTIGAYGDWWRGLPRIAPSATIGITDTKVGTVIQDVQIDTYTNFGLLGQPAVNTVGGAYRRIKIIGPAAAGSAQGINLSNWSGGVIEDCDISNCHNGTDYPSGAGAGIRLTTVDGTEIRFNRVYNCYQGIDTNTTGTVHRHLWIHHNRVLKCKVNCISMYGGVAGYPPLIAHNFVYHSPTAASAAGHGIVTQNAVVGPVWRNNIVVSDYTGGSGNVQLYCLSPAAASLPGADVDYNLGYIYPGSSGVLYGKLNTTQYTTFADWKTALVAASVTGSETHGVNADPLVSNLASEDFTLLAGSPAREAGVALGVPGEAYVGTAPDMGIFDG